MKMARVRTFISVYVLALALGYGQAQGSQSVTNDCDRPIYVSSAWRASEGADDINGNVSQNFRVSTAWQRVAPYQTVELPGNYIRVERKGLPISATQMTNAQMNETNERGLRNFCFGQGVDGGKKYVLNESTTGGRKPLLQACLEAGGEWKTYQYAPGSYHIEQQHCNPRRRDPKVMKMAFKRDPTVSSATIFRVDPGSWDWQWVDMNSFTAQEYGLQSEEKGFVILHDRLGYDRNRFAMKEGDFQVNYAGTAEFRRAGTGQWVGEPINTPLQP